MPSTRVCYRPVFPHSHNCEYPGTTVLNVSHNELKQIPAELANLSALKALILNNNDLRMVEHLDTSITLNTLVLSHNAISELSGVWTLADLTKLSVAHNQLHVIPDDIQRLTALKELRLNHNQITALPSVMRQLPQLEIIDMGNNQLREYADVEVLGELPNLHSLNLKGNPLCDKTDYKQHIKTMVPTLRVLDGERFDERFLARKENKKFQELRRERSERNATTSERKLARQAETPTATSATIVDKKRPRGYGSDVDDKKRSQGDGNEHATDSKKPHIVMSDKKKRNGDQVENIVQKKQRQGDELKSTMNTKQQKTQQPRDAAPLTGKRQRDTETNHDDAQTKTTKHPRTASATAPAIVPLDADPFAALESATHRHSYSSAHAVPLVSNPVLLASAERKKAKKPHQPRVAKPWATKGR